MAHITTVPVAEPISMVLLIAITNRRTKLAIPLLIARWHTFMNKHSLIDKYPNVLSTIQQGAVIRVLLIRHSFIPPNKPSIDHYSEPLYAIIHHEYITGRQLGLFTKAELKATIGPFQTSLLSIIPKLNKPGKFCLI
jgi:hypothetical protein